MTPPRDTATERLEKASHRMAEAIYRSGTQAQGAPGGDTAGGGGTESADDVIDAEVLGSDDTGKN